MDERDGHFYAHTVLHKLLDKYEVSRAFVRGEQTAKRIQIALTDALLPMYQSGGMDADDRRTLHSTLAAWATQGVIELGWVRFEEGNLLSRVILCWEGIEKAYQVLERTPKAEELAAIQEELATYAQRLTWPWLKRWLADVTDYIKDKKTLPDHLIPVEPNKRTLLLDALAGLVDKGEETLPMRLFSKRYLKSSKAFEQLVRTRFVSLLRQYFLPEQFANRGMPLSEDESAMLGEVGIETTHEDVGFCGPLVLEFDIKQPNHVESDNIISDDKDALCIIKKDFNTRFAAIHCAQFPFGLALDANVIDCMTIIDLPVRRILSIENKANYRHYIRNESRPDELVVYLGGFPSPGKRRFLKKLWDYSQSVMDGTMTESISFHHWGDLDYGGILIGQTVLDSVWPTMSPWRMEPKWLDNLAQFVEPFGDSYGAKLEALLSSPRYEIWYPLIRKLLEVGGTLEKEAFLV